MTSDYPTNPDAPPPLGALYEALAQAQSAFEPVTKNRTVTVYPKQRSDGYKPPSYSFDYATLDEVQRCTIPALSANGLTITQFATDTPDGRVFRTILGHSSGAELRCDIVLPTFSDVQDFGKTLTYLRRYQWSAICGISAEEDDDGNAADGNQAVVQKRPEKAAKNSKRAKVAEAPESPAAPLSLETRSEIRKCFQKLGLSGSGCDAFTRDVCGKVGGDPTFDETDGQLVLSRLREQLDAAGIV